VAGILDDMRKALADWDPRKANTLSDALEEALFELEKAAPRELMELK